MSGYMQNRGGEEERAFKSREGGKRWKMNLRPDLRRIGMCQLEMFLAEKSFSNRVLSYGGLFSHNALSYVVTGIGSGAQECHLGGRFFPFFWSDIFNMVVFHLCTFYLIFARLLPQIQIPLTSVLNKKKKQKRGAERSFSFHQGRKKFPNSLPDFLLHLIGPNWVTWPSSEERLEKYLESKKEVTWKD